MLSAGYNIIMIFDAMNIQSGQPNVISYTGILQEGIWLTIGFAQMLMIEIRVGAKGHDVIIPAELSHHIHISTMAKTKQKGITYTPPTKKQFPQLYKLKEKTTTRGSRSSWVKDSWSPTTKSVGSSPTKSPLKEKSSTSQMLYEGDDFGFDQGDIPQPKLPKSLASSNSSHSHF